MNKKYIYVFIVLVIVLLSSWIVITRFDFGFNRSLVTPTDTPTAVPTGLATPSLTPTPLSVPGRVEIRKLTATTYQLLLIANTDFFGADFKFNTTAGIQSFTPDASYDAVLENTISNGVVSISLGKLNNPTATPVKATDGAYVIGVFTVTTKGTITLVTSDSVGANKTGTEIVHFSEYSYTF